MSNRWFVLGVLFAARVTMAFQFQSIAALSPMFMQGFAVQIAEIGLLIGLYLAPGLVIALPGGAIGRRFGDRRMIAIGMALMLAGAAIMVAAWSWPGQVAGRVVAGTGGVLLNVLMTKVVTDHFAGREIATAMGIFVNSWPVGIAAALLVLPLIGGDDNLVAAQVAVLVVVLAGLALFLFGTRPAKGAAAAPPAPEPLRGVALAGVLIAGAIWGLYNGALGMIFGFGPALLAERGWSLAAASSTTSIVLWLVAVSLPLGGYLADRLGRRDSVMVLGFVTFAGLLWIAPTAGAVVPVFAALGISAGLPAGPIMSLPAAVLSPGTRAVGMGLFFTLFYVGVVFAPVLAGLLADRAGSSAAAFQLGVAMLAACCALLYGFRQVSRRVT